MRFQRLKLTGFKSFCDATDLYLEPGLTGVVGPNGCGKSNLVEALRWVMGESSYKAMRAAGMDEVIFSGSATRPGRNTAEVTLVLDNSDRSAPAPLNTADVLEVTRRIERESGSVYRVNGREVRARDVQLLFADASTGAHSPALVRQGQIGELIAAKPVQRRALLEEAAGISGLHSRRHEAELRLRAAEQNLERVDDIIAQVEQQLEALRRQARLAVRYRSLSGDIRKAEATLFHLRWVASRFAEKESEAEQGRLIGRLADASTAERAAARAAEEALARLKPLREAEAVAGAVLQRYTILRDQLEDEARRAESRRRELMERQIQIEADVARERALVAESDAALGGYRADLSAIEREVDGERTAAAEARAEVEALQAELSAAEEAARAAAEALAGVRAQRAQAERAATDAAARKERLQGQFAEVEAEATEVARRLAADATVAASTNEMDAARGRSSIAEAATLAAEERVARCQVALEAARPAHAETEKLLNRLEAEADTLARVLNAGGASLWPAIVDALQVESGFETALGAALGDDLEASSDAGAPLYWSEPGDGAGDPDLPLGVRPLSEVVGGVPMLHRRLRQTGLVDATEGLRLMPLLRPGQRLISIEGDLWRWDGFVAAADAPTAAAQRLAQRNRLAELDAEVRAARSERARLKEQVEHCAHELDAARGAERLQREAWRAAQHDIARAQSALDGAHKALADLTSRQSALAEAGARLTSSLAEAVAMESEARTAMAAAGGEAEALDQSESLQRVLAGVRERHGQARVVLGNFEAAARLRETRREQIIREIAGWERRAAGAGSQMAKLSVRAAEVAEQLAAVSVAPDGVSEKRARLDEQVDIAQREHRGATDALATAETSHREADKAARAAHDAVGAVREHLARVEERLKGAIGQRQQIEQLCLEALSIPAAKTAEAAGLRPEAPLPREEEIERRVERLKAERERLGGVNLAAEREAEEIKEKHDTMVADREDLIGAIARLRTGISSLNREGRARLTEAFDKVNGHFQELFTTLFGGGTAELRFVESDDPLEAGLEIIAKPPGKKPTTMTLLSGGEQALTALSLIFAVFLTNPAPICVLDEVDAPLDDANVERFCNLLDSMRERTDTRFVVITHNPITMSRVDRLFGVTMAERGVSQLVSVDLSGAHAVREAV